MGKRELVACFASFIFLVSRDCCVALPHDTTGLSAVCDCGISDQTACMCRLVWAFAGCTYYIV